jgi:DNA-binding PadR family transcriptional regulator
MTNDGAKDFVLQYLFDMQREYPQRHIGYPKAMIINAVDEDSGDEDDGRASVGMAIDYLEDEGYLKTQTQQHVKYYRLTSKAQDKLLPRSAYSKSQQNDGSIRLFNNGGVLVMGDNYGTVTVDKRIQITNELEKIADLIQETNEVSEAEKADLIQSVATLQAQIKMQTPDKTIVERAWDTLQGASAIAGTVQLIGQLQPLILHVIKAGLGG